MLLVPWGYTRSKASDYDDLLNVARKATKAISKIHGTEYQVGPSSNLLYPTSGKYFKFKNSFFKKSNVLFLNLIYFLSYYTSCIKFV